MGPAKPQVSIISADVAVRQALLLLMESEGITSRAFTSVWEFPAATGTVLRGQPHCVLLDPTHRDQASYARLTEHLVQGDGPVTVVVLAAEAHRPRRRAEQSSLTLVQVDPFRVDEILAAIRTALLA
ncbi:response regulator transcription factor [Falsiroseomonas tokyonensis]|uniref:Response regulatory domain-containing protein n=1 Tax=Falsiroseomonas tokyonensis TaxID=430521 RepID=A0ABV7C483_9PROT|nr:hypothetical protein [Falsiroseomonas tokyonensis]MBU8541439.1 hypothetical protein [Falsiroseomonas tokyonensis]